MAYDPMKKLVVQSLPGRPEHVVPRRRRFRGRHLFILLVVALAAFFGYKKYYPLLNGRIEKPVVMTAASPAPEVPPLQTVQPVQKQEDLEKFEIKHQLVRSGDSIGSILERCEIAKSHISDWERCCKPAPFSQLREGDELIFFLDRPERELVKVFYSASGGPAYALRKIPGGWECQSQVQEISAAKLPVRTVQGRYAENFYDSCIAAGLPVGLISNLADIFAYDVDFMSDLKDGDTFTVFFQEQEIEGKDGKQHLILAAEMSVSGKVYQAFGFQVPEDGWEYFDGKGASLKRSFLKSPFNYRRMISPSSYKNLRPVLKIYRPRLGIDYAAPKGAPVSVIGDGVISSLNKRGSSGLSIEVRHRGGFKSVYSNLSGYSRGLNKGGIVYQGEVIGTVGSGPGGKSFLNFHLLKNNKPVSFQSADFQRTIILPKSIRPEFEKIRDSYLAALRGRVAQKSEMPSDGQ